MVSRKNIKYKAQQDAKRVPHYGLRKLSVGVASVLLGTVVYMQNGSTVHADVNPTVSAGNDSAKVTNENVGVGYSAGASSELNSSDSASSVVAAGAATDSPVSSQASGSSAEKATNSVSNAVSAVSESGSVTPSDQVNAGADNSNSLVPNRQTSTAGNPSNNQLSDNLVLSTNQKSNINFASLLASKVALTGSNNTANGGFDEATWGKLDVNAWQGHVQGDYYQLTDYTGDANHVIVPNEADFAKAGISTSGKQVGVTSDLMKHIFKDKATAQDATVAFSKTDNKMVKAIDSNWSNTWKSEYSYPKVELSKFDGANLDVSNVTNMNSMFYEDQISDLSSLANWKVNNVTNMNSMFEQNHIIDISSLANWKVDNVTNMSYMFFMNHISDLSSLANWKVNNVTDMSHMFDQNQISDLSPLANWKVNNVTDMSHMFEQNQVSNLSPLANWKVDNVINMGNMLDQNQISDLSPLANWKVNNVTDMSYMFGQNQISNLSPLTNWKVDNVHEIGFMFASNQISDLSPLTNWNVNNVGEMFGMFGGNQISDLSPLANWKVDNVHVMGSMFAENQISDLSPLANWKVDNVKDMSQMFYGNHISDLSPLANWNVNSVQYVSRMFDNNSLSITQAKRVINFVYPEGYTGKKRGPITQTVDLPQKVEIELTTKDDYNRSNNILDWVTKTETPETPAPAYFKDYIVPAIKGLLEPDKTVIAGQQADITKPINVTVTYKLVDSNTNDAFALDSKNGLHEHANVNDNGGYDTDFWGALDVSKFTTVKNGDNLEITGYNGDASKVIIPNIADFELNNLDQGAKQVTISSQVMRKLAKNAARIGLSKTNNQKVVASDAIWQDAFGGMTNEPNTSSNANGGMWVYNPNLTAMDLHNLDTTNITDMSAMFNGGRNLNVVGDLSQWNTANVASMKIMFQRASSLTNIGNLDNWDTSKVTDMNSMFIYATNLTNIGDLSKWQTDNVTNMGAMFGGTTNLTNIGNLDNWNTGNVTDMSLMFANATGLTNIGSLYNWNTSNVTDMSYMFANAANLTNIGDLSKWKTGNVVDMHSVFYNATSLTNIGNLDNWDTSNVTNMNSMFYNATSLTNIGNLDNWDTSNVTNMNSMFSNATGLTNIGNLDDWNTSNVTDMSWMFGTGTDTGKQSHLTNIGDLSKWQTGNVTDMSCMFSNATDLTNIGDLSNWDTSEVTDMHWMFGTGTGKQSHLTNIGDLSKWNTSKVTDMHWMFANATSLINIGDLSKWQTDNVTDMNSMFLNATSLINIGNLDNWDTGNVTNMSWMFGTGTDIGKQSHLTNIGDLSKWQTGNVTNMNSMFSNATNLTNIGDLSNWDTSKVTDMHWMFGGTTNLTNIGNLDNWDTSKVTDMSGMFYNAINLTNIGDLSKWQTDNVTNMAYMFTNAINLTNIGDLSKWQTGNVTNMMWMFVSTKALHHLNISNWNLTKLVNKASMKYMFADDTDLTIIANDLALPAWYQNEINDADYFWNHHIAVITNVPELIRATGDIDSLKIDNQNASRSIFYDSKGSSDAIQVLKDANQAYVKQYQNEHPGYTLNLAAYVDQTNPIALANANFISVPREVQFTIAYYDLTGKLVNSTTSTHKVDETVSISPVAPVNYVLANGQLSMNCLMHWGLNEVDFLVTPKVTTTTQTKTVSRTIKVQTPDGQTHNVVQTVTFTRNGYLNQVTKQTTYSLWSFGGHYQFSGYQPKPMDGYTADVISTVTVTPDSLDTTVNVAYHKIPVVYEIDYQLADGTLITKAQNVATNDGMLHLTAPQGYRLLTTVTDVQVGSSSQKLAVLVAPAEQTYTAHDALPSGVTEPLIKTVTRTVKITMSNGHTRTVKQSVKFERTATVDSTGQVTYGNWQAIGRAQFNKVFVAKRHGYHLVITDTSGKVLTAVEKIDNVTAAMDDAVISVKYVKD